MSVVERYHDDDVTQEKLADEIKHSYGTLSSENFFPYSSDISRLICKHCLIIFFKYILCRASNIASAFSCAQFDEQLRAARRPLAPAAFINLIGLGLMNITDVTSGSDVGLLICLQSQIVCVTALYNICYYHCDISMWQLINLIIVIESALKGLKQETFKQL